MMQNCNLLNLFTTPWFWSALLAWVCAQSVKMVRGYFKTGKVDFQYLLSTGGMPSAHTAMVCGLFTSFGLTLGFDHPMTMMALGFASIVMFDAASVRRAAGQQARILNQIVEELFRQHKFSQTRLKELLGHTRTEVLVGMATGIAVATVVCFCWCLFL